MPIIGLEKTIFGYIIEGSGNNGPSYRFVFCDEEGTETAFEIEDYLILSVYQHYYSANVSLETKNVIIVDSQKNIITIGGYHFEKKYIQEITPIGDNGLTICTPTIIIEDKFGKEPHFFHPVSYLNLKDSPHIIDLKKGIFWNQKYYLFSIMNMHFIVDIENTKFENPDDFTYHLIDEYGNTIYTWNKDNQIKCVWRRVDESFTIFSISKFDNGYCGYDNSESSNKKLYWLTLITWEKDKRYENRFIVNSNILESFNYRLGCNDRYCIKLDFSGLFCDNNYFIAKESCGFISFNKNKLLATNDFRNLIPIDKWDYNDSEYKPSISNFNYGNGIVGLQLMKCYTGECPPEDNKCDYNKKIGNYRLYDIYGNCIGELKDDVMKTPVNGIGITQYCGVVSKSDFSFIIPPIFKEIVPLNRYILHEENDKITNSIDNDSNSGPKKLMSLSEYWAKKYRIIEDKRLYIVTQEIGYGGRIQRSLFEEGTELVPLGDYDIKKVSGQYVLVKESSQSLYKLYFHNGKVLLEGVKDAIAINIYGNKNDLWKSHIIHNELVPKLVFSRIYIKKGFWVMVEDKCIINELLIDMIPVLYTNEDAFYTGMLLNGSNILFSINKGLLISGYEGTNIRYIYPQFNADHFTFSRHNHYSDFSHVIKYGNALTPDMRESVVKKAYFDDITYIRFEEETDMEESVLCVITNDGKTGFYSIVRGWLVQPEEVEVLDYYSDYLIFNQSVINKNGNVSRFNDILHFINKTGDNSAYYDSSQNKYVIINEEGFVYESLDEIETEILVSNKLDSFHKKQIILNISTKDLTIKMNPNYKDYDYCPDPNEWTDEDSWDAMTDGMYGDYPGPSWDMEQFGY